MMEPRRLVAQLLAPALMAGALLSGACSPDRAADTAVAALAADSPAGRWHLQQGGRRLVLDLGAVGGRAFGEIRREGEPAQKIERIDWQPETGTLSFRSGIEGHWRWYRAVLVDGVLRGRATLLGNHSDMPAASGFTEVMTGWHARRFDQERVPRSWDVQLADGRLARIRIDRGNDPDGTDLVGTYKVFASRSRHSNAEELEYALSGIEWDGETLRFQRALADGIEQFEARAEGRHLHGRYRHDGDGRWRSLHGTRAELLGYGLSARMAAERDDWQALTRRRVAHLLMAGAPDPVDTSVQVLQARVPARRIGRIDEGRDDMPEQWPANYTLDELSFRWTFTAGDGAALERHAHGWIASPAAEGGRRPAVIVLNGHASSAWQMFDPDAWMYWYGDAFARRGHVVLGLDVSHRDYGDDPDGGNHAHPAISRDGLRSEWEQDGERAWDVMRAIDYLLARDDVDPDRIVLAGLSMGAEVAVQAAALDTRVRLTVLGGFMPDLQVMAWNGNHECWQWLNADINEYVDLSTYLALVAPRALIAQSAARDFTFSRRDPPFSADLQVARRARVAWNDQSSRFIHLLHDGEHSLRTGVRDGGVRAFAHDVARVEGDPHWQTAPTTAAPGRDLFELVEQALDDGPR